MVAKPVSAAIWTKRVAGLEASGLSCRKYATQIGVNPHTLAGWRWKLRQGGAKTRRAADRATPALAELASECGFVDVTNEVTAALVKERGEIEIEVGGALVRVRGQVDGETLTRVLGAVGGRR